MSKYRTLLFGNVEILEDRVIIQDNLGKKSTVMGYQISNIIPNKLTSEIKIETKEGKAFSIYPLANFGGGWNYRPFVKRIEIIKGLKMIKKVNLSHKTKAVINQDINNSKIGIRFIHLIYMMIIIMCIIYLINKR